LLHARGRRTRIVLDRTRVNEQSIHDILQPRNKERVINDAASAHFQIKSSLRKRINMGVSGISLVLWAQRAMSGERVQVLHEEVLALRG